MTAGQSTRERVRRIIFEADTPAGKWFDVALISCILLSIAVVLVDSVADLRARYGSALQATEWVLTALFTLEYAVRLLTAVSAPRYARSLFGVIDLLSILPTYLSLLVPGSQSLLVIRALRVLRIFRVLKLTRFVTEAHLLRRALAASRHKITVFLVAVLCVVVICGAIMYLIEGAAAGFTSIPRSMYWAIVTMTTVGYGDIAPQTPLGQLLAALLMVLGYGIIAVPTGIVSAELVQAGRSAGRRCDACNAIGHDSDARYCKACGERL